MLTFCLFLLSIISLIFLFYCAIVITIHSMRVFNLLRKAGAPFWQSLHASNVMLGISDAKVLCDKEDIPIIDSHFLIMGEMNRKAIILFLVLFFSNVIGIFLSKQ